MTKGWTVCRIRESTVNRIEKMTSVDVGFDYGLQLVLDDYERVLSQLMVKPAEEPVKEPEKKIVIIKEDIDNDLLVNWFIKHPDIDVKRLTSLELEVLERDIKSGRR